MKTTRQPLGLVAIALAAMAIVPTSCGKNDDKKPPESAPVSITSFNPAEAAIGATVVISGKNFSDDKSKNAVKFNGVSATVTEAKTAELSVTVPEGAATGKITVTVNNVTATSATDFKVNASAPQISSFGPEKGDAGAEVTIAGQRFTNDSKVYFGEIPATTVTFVNSTTLKAVAPAAVLTAKIKVVVGTLDAISANDFIATPRITGLSAVKGDEGALITITGVNFSNTKEYNTVAFGDGLAVAAEIESATATELKVKAPVAGKDGKVSVTVAGLKGSSANDFTYNATITDFNPKSGPRGTLVTLKGKRLGATPAIEINGAPATITFRATDQTEIRFNIPDQLSVVGDKIKVKTKSQEYLTAVPFVVTNAWKKLRDAVAGQFYEKGFMFVHNNEICIGLGKNAAGGLNNTYAKYNIATNSWSAPITLPTSVTPRYDVSYAKLNDRVFVMGGLFGPATYTRTVNFLELSDGTWKTADVLKTNSAGGVAFVINNTLYAGLGSVGPATSTHKIAKFDNATLTWDEGSFTELYNAGNINNSCFVIGNTAYVGHGKNSANTEKKGFFKYTDFNMMAAVAECPVATEGASSFTYNGKGYVKAVHDLYEYDPAKNEWKKINTTDGIYVNYLTVVNNRIFGIGYNGEVFEYIP